MGRREVRATNFLMSVNQRTFDRTFFGRFGPAT
jgi:hypothetical protein